MKYDGYQVGIVIKSLRIQRKLTKEGLAAELGISESTIKKYENGERALSITNLFKIIDYFKVDANTILNVAESKKESSIDSRLELMDCSKRAYFQKIFNEMLDNNRSFRCCNRRQYLYGRYLSAGSACGIGCSYTGL